MLRPQLRNISNASPQSADRSRPGSIALVPTEVTRRGFHLRRHLQPFVVLRMPTNFLGPPVILGTPTNLSYTQTDPPVVSVLNQRRCLYLKLLQPTLGL